MLTLHRVRWGLLALGLFLFSGMEAQAQQQPFGRVSSCVVTVTTTPTSLAALITTACASAKIPDKGVLVWNNSTTSVCVGDFDVNTTVTAGGKCYPICTNTTNCKRDEYSAPASPSSVYLVVAAATQVVTVHIGGSP